MSVDAFDIKSGDAVDHLLRRPGPVRLIQTWRTLKLGTSAQVPNERPRPLQCAEVWLNKLRHWSIANGL
jgi:hypothetical protein